MIFRKRQTICYPAYPLAEINTTGLIKLKQKLIAFCINDKAHNFKISTKYIKKVR